MSFKTILGLAIAAGALASCSVEDAENAQVPASETYTRNFIKMFGTINPNQDWNVVTQKSITVNTDSPVDVLVYEKQDNEYRLAADYKAVSGKKTITFDGLEGDDTPFIVSIDGKQMFAKNGETVDYTGTSASRSKRASASASSSHEVWRSTTAETITAFGNDKTLWRLTADGKDHSEAFDYSDDTSNILISSLDANQFTIYPIYHGSEESYEFGYYFTNNGTIVERVPVYTTGKYADDFTEIEGETSKGGGSLSSHGYVMKTTLNEVFGAYVKHGDKYYYSANPELSDNKKCQFAVKSVNLGDKVRIYILFDDPEEFGEGSGDLDFNDLVMTYTWKVKTVDTPVSWLVACEDLGGTFDYDFNDVVFRVSHVSGQETLTITPLAAGGTLDAYLFYGDKQVSEEWHQHFGDGYSSGVMINTGQNKVDKVWPIKLTGVPANFSMTSLSSTDGGFKIYVPSRDYSVTGPQKGEAPQMLVLPSDWSWPTEQIGINIAYPNFGEWGSNYTDPAWVNTKTDGKYMNVEVSAGKANKEVQL